MTKEKRQHHRYTTLITLDVYRSPDNTLLGQLIDISQQGIRLHSTESLPLNMRQTLGIILLDEQTLDPERTFTAQTIWRAPASPNDGWYYGLRLLEKPTEWSIIMDAVHHQLTHIK